VQLVNSPVPRDLKYACPASISSCCCVVRLKKRSQLRDEQPHTVPCMTGGRHRQEDLQHSKAALFARSDSTFMMLWRRCPPASALAVAAVAVLLLSSPAGSTASVVAGVLVADILRNTGAATIGTVPEQRWRNCRQKQPRSVAAFAPSSSPCRHRRCRQPRPVQVLQSAAEPPQLCQRMRRPTHNAVQSTGTGSSSLEMMMVRNIDFPEAIVLYDVLVPRLRVDESNDDDDDDDSNSGDGKVLRECWHNLLKQCKEYDTPVVCITDPRSENDDDDNNSENSNSDVDHDDLIFFRSEQPAPSPHDLLRSIELLQIQPDAFGGSSGFGRVQNVDPPRSPLPARTVVFGRTADHSRAARFAGMRVVSLTDNDLADAVLFDAEADLDDLWLEDLATPGSYWLNPPHPRDELGNKVDPELVAKQFLLVAAADSKGGGGDDVNTNKRDANDRNSTGDDEISLILADLSPL